ncbi:MAG: methylated-DNA--[Christensenellaceae bacterium]|nr:methylated-DNA--[protein]-cysteine S-methyltransferase [Christensenellaceae bacterium]
MNGFFEEVYALVARIPAGKVAGYGQLAAMLGAVGSARQVGWAMRRCPQGLPAHRVIKSDGSLAQSDFYEPQKAMLLAEGVTFLPSGKVDMAACRWTGEED